MFKKTEFMFYFIQNKLKLYRTAFKIKYLKMNCNNFPKKIAGRKVINNEDGNKVLYEMIKSEKPFCAVRYGGTEMNAIWAARKIELGIKSPNAQLFADLLQTQSGFFPPEVDLLFDYLHLILDCSKDIDIMITFKLAMENYMLRKYIPKSCRVMEPQALEPFRFQNDIPWSKALAGKKVLIIHPFSETIKKQYTNKDKLFENPDVLPDFELHTLKAVQTIGGTKDERFENWFEALDYMYNEAMKIDFDIALLGCGAYGMPLAVKLKKAGKQAIVIGGGLQLLFGIKGKRWDNGFPEITSLYNEYWVRPSAEETPEKQQKLDDAGAYW